MTLENGRAGLLAALLALAATAGAAAQGPPAIPGVPNPAAPGTGVPNNVAPYRFSPAPGRLSPAEQQKAYAYRLQLEQQQRALEQLDAQGRLDAAGRDQLVGTRSELMRMNRELDH